MAYAIITSALIAAVAILSGVVWSINQKLKGVMVILALTSKDKVDEIAEKFGVKL